MPLNAARTPIHSGKINLQFIVAPVVCSLISFALVVGNIAASVPRQADEGTAAHLFQLLIAAQAPLVIGFATTADWKRPTVPVSVLAAQALALALALGSLAWSGY